MKPKINSPYLERMKNVAEGIYVIENWLSLEECEQIELILDNLSEDEWNLHGNYEIGDHIQDHWEYKISTDIVSPEFLSKLMEVIVPSYWSFKHTTWNRLRPGESWNPNIVNLFAYNIIVYAGVFEGGEIFIPSLDIEYKPGRGSLVFIDSRLRHGVKEVVNGVRYCYTDFAIPHPGFFIG